MPADTVNHYFPKLTSEQKVQFDLLEPLYTEWNSRINVISRKDFQFFYERHVLHSLAIAKVISFTVGTKVLDVGTGGGFPGIPLAILFPETHFHLVDSIGKKIKVVNEVVQALQLKNVTTSYARAEEVKQKFDFVISRAVTQLQQFIPWIEKNILTKNINSLPNGILYLKGGDLTEELVGIKKKIQIFELKNYFEEEFFETKKLIWVGI